ncbi:MAG: hypothetical protein AAF550_06625 [Myxococcota bacterium]
MQHLPDTVQHALHDHGAIAGEAAQEDLQRTDSKLGVRKPQPKADAQSRTHPPTQSELCALLVQYEGNVAAVSRLLGKERMQVHRWMKRYGIDPNEYRG